jgi:3-isopropylmalate/(R)-2-methylmalate dehydratase large subunit
MNTLFDKIWDKHVVQIVKDGPTQLYIDRLYCHEVTSPQAFSGMRERGLKCFRPDHIYCMPDHNTPTHDQDKPIADPISKKQVDTLAQNTKEFGLTHFGMLNPKNGIIHVVGPERGLSLPGMTIVCGDSHTSTHGAMGAVAFGIGTSEVEMVMATECILQQKPKSMRISVDGKLGKGVTAKDVALYIMSKMTTSGATGYFVEYAGSAVKNLTMEGRLTLCNLTIEMGARGGFIAPDETTFEYIKGREYAPKGAEWDKAVAYWRTLKSGDDAVFDKEIKFDAADIEPMVTYGTNPGMGMGISQSIPAMKDIDAAGQISFKKSLDYMGFQPGEQLLGKKVDYVFCGIRKEGLDKIFEAAGFELRQPGCSACLAMNDDKIPAGKLSVSTSNRNFEGRQGPGARTVLASPLVAAAAAITGIITDPRSIM